MGLTTAASVVKGSIVGNDISLSAGIFAESQQHIFKPSSKFGTKIGDAPVTYEDIVYVASGAAQILGFHGLVNVSGSSASITIDMHVNGASVLSAPITITNATGNRVVVSGTVTTTTLNPGDLISFPLIVSSSTGMSGVFAWASIRELTMPQ